RNDPASDHGPNRLHLHHTDRRPPGKITRPNLGPNLQNKHLFRIFALRRGEESRKASPCESYSTLWLLGFPVPIRSGKVSPRWPGVTKMPIVTGISLRWIRLSMTVGTRNTPWGLMARAPSWNTSTQAGLLETYWAGTYTQYLRTVLAMIRLLKR